MLVYQRVTLLDDIQYILKKNLWPLRPATMPVVLAATLAARANTASTGRRVRSRSDSKSLTEKNEKNDIIVDFMRFS